MAKSTSGISDVELRRGFERLRYSDEEAERKLLCFMLDSRWTGHIVKQSRPEWFYGAVARKVFVWLRAVLVEKVEVPSRRARVASEFLRLKKIAGKQEDVDRTIGIVRRTWRKREIQLSAERLWMVALNSPEDYAACLEAEMSKIEEKKHERRPSSDAV